MIKIDRLALADSFEPEEIVDEIFSQCPDLKFPIPVIEIAKSCDILGVLPFDLSSKKLAGILVSDPVKEYGVILHQRYADAIGRERFSIAHELGHFLLQHHAPISYCFDSLTPASNVREQEKEADKFATLLLMPERLISSYLDNAEFCFKTLNQLSRRAEVSVSALINRCCELSQSQTLIAVYSKRGICSYTWTNWSLLRGHRLKKMKKKLFPFDFVLLSEGSITEKEKVPIDKWFENVMGEPFILFEQTYFQSNGYAITLLTMQHHD